MRSAVARCDPVVFADATETKVQSGRADVHTVDEELSSFLNSQMNKFFARLQNFMKQNTHSYAEIVWNCQWALLNGKRKLLRDLRAMENFRLERNRPKLIYLGRLEDFCSKEEIRAGLNERKARELEKMHLR